VLKRFSDLKSINLLQDDGYIALPVEFEPRGPGYYPCDIILRSLGDVRLYKVDCTVSPAGTVARLDFTTPAHQSITQNIPIVSEYVF